MHQSITFSQKETLNLIFGTLRKTHVVKRCLVPETLSLPSTPALGMYRLDVLRTRVVGVQDEPLGVARGLVPGNTEDGVGIDSSSDHDGSPLTLEM